MKFRTIENLRDIMLQSANKVFNNKINWVVALWFKAFIMSMAEGIFNVQNILKNAINQLFPQTATGEFLEMFGGWESLPKKTGSPATGKVNIIGIGAGSVGIIIPVGTSMQSQAGIVYETTDLKAIEEITIDLVDFYISSGKAYVQTDGNHNYSNGQKPELSLSGFGSIIPDDGIIVTDDDKFEFDTDESPFSFAGGTSKDYFATINVESISLGFVTNINAGELALVSTISPDVSDTILIQTAIKNGSNPETDDAYRARILLSRQQMRGVFSVEQVVSAGLRIDGNTRIIVDKPIPGTEETPKNPGFQPIPGETVVYVIRDLPDGSIETPVAPAILDETKTAIIEYAKLPAHVSSDDVYVFSPLLNPVDITLKVFPDTATMRIAVENSIDAFFKDNVAFDEESQMNALISAINETQDLTTGALLQDFEIVTPATIPFAPKHITVKGTITFNNW